MTEKAPFLTEGSLQLFLMFSSVAASWARTVSDILGIFDIMSPRIFEKEPATIILVV